MPEGHTIHRQARLQRDVLVGSRIRAWSPQGRFAEGAARLDGRMLRDIEALGKHLLYRWEGAAEILHVHLGIYGKFKTFHADPPAPSEATRLAMANGRSVVYLAGPTVCELIDRDEEERLRDRLGPDPLASPRAVRRFAANLARRQIPVGAALLDQRVVAGVGNVYRAEVLFKEGIDPHLPARRLEERDAGRLWRRIATELRRGERAGRIVTVAPADLGVRSRADIPREERLYVYKRDGLGCRRCGTIIRSTVMANRLIWWCPACQPA
jgi:formamidopyrimidine-DNA glycosylase